MGSTTNTGRSVPMREDFPSPQAAEIEAQRSGRTLLLEACIQPTAHDRRDWDDGEQKQGDFRREETLGVLERAAGAVSIGPPPLRRRERQHFGP